jgi:hypothetical protein
MVSMQSALAIAAVIALALLAWACNPFRERLTIARSSKVFGVGDVRHSVYLTFDGKELFPRKGIVYLPPSDFTKDQFEAAKTLFEAKRQDFEAAGIKVDQWLHEAPPANRVFKTNRKLFQPPGYPNGEETLIIEPEGRWTLRSSYNDGQGGRMGGEEATGQLIPSEPLPTLQFPLLNRIDIPREALPAYLATFQDPVGNPITATIRITLAPATTPPSP